MIQLVYQYFMVFYHQLEEIVQLGYHIVIMMFLFVGAIALEFCQFAHIANLKVSPLLNNIEKILILPNRSLQQLYKTSTSHRNLRSQ